MEAKSEFQFQIIQD